MKTRILILIGLSIFMVACQSNDNKPLTKTEEKAVETQIQKDQEAMDSLEKAIQAQINSVDSVK